MADDANGVLAEYLTEAELARDIKKSQRTIQRWKRVHQGPRRTILGRTTLYHKRDVKEWLEAQREDRPQRRRVPRTPTRAAAREHDTQEAEDPP